MPTLLIKGRLKFSAITCSTSLATPTDGNAPTCDDGDNHGSICSFTCITGFGLSSTTPVVCTGDGTSPDGEWTSAEPTCIGKYRVS